LLSYLTVWIVYADYIASNCDPNSNLFKIFLAIFATFDNKHSTRSKGLETHFATSHYSEAILWVDFNLLQFFV
jgi:hypothetical protein